MDISRANMDMLYTALNGALLKGIGQAWAGYTDFAMVIPSSTAIEKYPVSIFSGAMREWIGERVINFAQGKFLDVINRDFERTEGVPMNDIEDDQVGFYTALFTSMGVANGELWARLATEALAHPGKWADGVDFFSASRKLGKVTINNVVAGTLSGANYETARSQMMSFRDAAGVPLGLVPTCLVVGPSNEGAAKRILNAETTIENGVAVSNIHKGEASICLDPMLVGDDAGKWFLICGNRGIKPIVVQQRKSGVLQRWDKESDECVKSKNRAEYGLHSRGAAAGAMPHLVIGGNL